MCLAFPVAYFINPVHLGVLGVILFILSGLVGFLASATLGKKFSRCDSDPRTTVMAFAFIFFVGIYAPLCAVWANAPFYSWARTHKEKSKHELLVPVLATAIEETATGTYLGGFVLLGIACLLPRWAERRRQNSGCNDIRTTLRLGWVDIALGIFALLQSLGAFMMFNIPADGVNLFALLFLAFLQCFLFRSLRLDCQSLWKRAAQAEARHLSKTAGTVLLLCLVLCSFVGFFLFASAVSLENVALSRTASLLSICTVISLVPLVVYHLLTKRHLKTGNEQMALANHFAIRCGFWALLGFFLILGGLVLKGLAQKELNDAPPDLATPFAYSIIALLPVCPSGAFLFSFAVFGGFFVALVLPHGSILAHQRILASAQGGAVGGAVFFSLLIVVALSLGLCTVPCIPAPEPPEQISAHFMQLLLADGKWPLLGGLYVIAAFCFAAWLASIWAIEAMFACVIIWIKELF